MKKSKDASAWRKNGWKENMIEESSWKNRNYFLFQKSEGKANN